MPADGTGWTRWDPQLATHQKVAKEQRQMQIDQQGVAHRHTQRRQYGEVPQQRVGRVRRDFSGHPEAAAMELAEARRAVREDAGLSIDEIPERVAKRHSEIAGKMHLAEQDLSDEETPAEAQHEGDVP